jgi:hypothetical protein
MLKSTAGVALATSRTFFNIQRSNLPLQFFVIEIEFLELPINNLQVQIHTCNLQSHKEF